MRDAAMQEGGAKYLGQSQSATAHKQEARYRSQGNPRMHQPDTQRRLQQILTASTKARHKYQNLHKITSNHTNHILKMVEDNLYI